MAKNEKAMDGRVRYFGELKAKAKDAILLFRCGDFYEAYYEDAKVVADVCGVTLTRENGNGGYMCGFPHYDLDVYLPKLVRYCNTPDAEVKRIAICDQLPEPPKPTVKRSETESDNNSNNQTSEDKTMKTNENNIETKNVQNAAQVSNVNTDVDVPEVDDIVPKVTKKKVAEAMVQAANGGPATTMPLGSHGTLVIAGVPKSAMPQRDKNGKFLKKGSAPSSRPSEASGEISRQARDDNHLTKVQDSVPGSGLTQTDTDGGGKLTYQTYEKTKVNKTTGKPYTVTHAKIMGFAATDEAYQRGVELHGAVSGEMVDGMKVLGLYFSHRYAAAAKDVCDALNAGKPFAECKAIIDNATEENAKKREEWKAKIEERKQKREERKAAKNQPSDGSPQTSEKSYTLDEVAAMLGKLLPDGAASTEDIKKLLKAA